MCLYPKLILNPKYKATKKNGGKIPPLTDHRVKYVPIGCQNCMECRKKKAREWQTRMSEDIKTNKNGKFITLTLNDDNYAKLHKEIIEITNEKIDGLRHCKIYTDDTRKQIQKLIDDTTGYNLDNAIATLAVRRFLERWRKEYKKSIRHWLVTELGHEGTENIHLHGIIWTDEPLQKIEDHWQYGYVWKGKRQVTKRNHVVYHNYVNEATIGYITKYVNKQDEKHKLYKAQILTSAGIGSNYTNTPDSKRNQYQDKVTNETYKTRTGHKIAIPIYWRNKIYTEEQREKLWLIKLDKQERWICGEKISIKNGDRHYYKLLKFHQERNHQLGYGDDRKNWTLQKYEEQRRAILQGTRIKRAA